jgi:hypothetical protein
LALAPGEKETPASRSAIREEHTGMSTSGTPERCLLCGKQPRYLGIFVPHQPSRLGGKKALTYLLCERCQRRHGSKQGKHRIEAALKKQLSERNGP